MAAMVAIVGCDWLRCAMCGVDTLIRGSGIIVTKITGTLSDGGKIK